MKCRPFVVLTLSVVTLYSFGAAASGVELSVEQATNPSLQTLPTTGQTPSREPFSVSLVPSVPVPIRVGTQLGFRLSSSTAGYASLYLIDPVGRVSVLAENLPLAAGSLDYPSVGQGFTLTAAEPIGFNRVTLLVTRQPFDGFSGDDTLTSPVSLALTGNAFMAQLERATAFLPRASWATDEIQVRIVG